MRRNCARISLLLRDERSAVRRKAAVVCALVVLIFAGAGVILTALGEDVYRGADRRILRASESVTGQLQV